jgi:glutamate synthase domain-containing protein 2
MAAGAAISGISIVCGENVCGIDPGLETKVGRVVRSPEMERRVNAYRKWYEGVGDLIVQLNIEDSRLGVAEYIVQDLGLETIELKWGQGAKCIGGEIKIDTLERALELQKRGYIITPNPSTPAVQAAFKTGALREFERHSRLGFIDEQEFLGTVEYLRRTVGAKRITLKTGAYPFRELAKAIKWSSWARIDLVTIDGAGGGTGMSPWRMMQEWGIPTFYLQCMAWELCQELAKRGEWVPNLAMAGGFSTEDHIFKVLAMGSHYFKAVCMGRALMIPAFVGTSIGNWLNNGNVPKTVSAFGTSPEQIFITHAILKEKYGDQMKELPLGAIGMYTFIDKLRVGLSQLMAGARSFRLDTISRSDVVALTEEAAKVSGLEYVTDAFREEAFEIINS